MTEIQKIRKRIKTDYSHNRRKRQFDQVKSTIQENTGGKIKGRERSTLEEGRPKQAQEDFGRGSAGQNIWKYGALKEVYRKKRKYGDERETSKKKIVGGEIRREQKNLNCSH